MRLNKFLALSGVGSRRTCDEIIAAGRVRVNAKIVRKMGIDVVHGRDFVTVDNKAVSPITYEYYMLNKPLNTITAVADDNKKTIMEAIDSEERLFPVGRLDYNTTGLLVLTNNGEVAQKLMHPKYKIEKEYLATVKEPLSVKELKAFASGLDLGDFITQPAKITLVKKGQNTIYSVIIHEGKNRQIRRMFAALGHTVLALKRIKFGKLTLGDLKSGEMRNLTQPEIDYLLSL